MSTLAVNTITDTTGLLAPVFPAGSAQLNPMAGREDRVINGDFSLWQRGASFSTAVYGADRWANNFATGTVTQSLQTFAPGEKLGVVNPSYFLRQTVSGQTLSTSAAITTQRIEGVRSYAGETITVLFWARRSSGAGNMSFDVDQVFGSGGTPSANVLGIGTASITLSNVWTPYAVVLAVPSISGKVLGTSNNDYLGLNFWASAGSNFNSRTNNLGLQTIGVDLWGVHIRMGTWTAAATADYRPRDPATELALCQRYFETGLGALVVFSGNVTVGVTYYSASVRFSVIKRVVPTFGITPNSTSAFNNVAGTISAGQGGFFEARNAIATGAGVWSSFWAADAEIY